MMVVPVVKLSVEFLTSAVHPDQFPAPTVPEVAFSGRSNVGKSSLINALVGEAIAHVSSTPGRTQMINFFDVTSGSGASRRVLRLVDLPGYGYAKVSRELSAEWPKFIEPYLREREAMRLCVCLVDTNIPPQESDGQLLKWLQHHERPYLVVGTKPDRLSGNGLPKSMAALRRAHEVGEVLAVSAKTRKGIPDLWQRILDATSDSTA